MFCRSFCSAASSVSSVVAKGLPTKLPIPGVKHVILVSSAKGGVGKSCSTVNLAFAVRRIDPSATVGILDADVFGPSIPQMMGLQGQQPQVDEQKVIIPLVNYGIKCMSMGFLVSPDEAIVWRGLMVMQGIQKLLRGVRYGPLDYLFVDMPPGTGDTQLSVVQNIAISGAVIVTTPQAVALIDARRGILMFKKVNVKILGLMQNMSYFECEKCSHQNRIYGDSDGISELAAQAETQIIARIPFDQRLMHCNELGKPFLLQYPDSSISKLYETTAANLMGQLIVPLDHR